MKKTIALVLAALLLAALLCACGDMRGNDTPRTEQPNSTMDLLPDMSPMPSPDPEDGIVDDTDGLIEDEDSADGRGAAGGTADGGTGTRTPSSPMPSTQPSEKP